MFVTFLVLSHSLWRVHFVTQHRCRQEICPKATQANVEERGGQDRLITNNSSDQEKQDEEDETVLKVMLQVPQQTHTLLTSVTTCVLFNRCGYVLYLCMKWPSGNQMWVISQTPCWKVSLSSTTQSTAVVWIWWSIQITGASS